MHQLLRMGRGAVIPLTASPNDAVWVLVNNHPVARGDIQLDDDKISVEITDAGIRASHWRRVLLKAPLFPERAHGGTGRRASLRC
eukprot:gene13617-18276_t